MGRSSPGAKYDAAERTPFLAGYIPVATAAHTGSGWVGRIVARSIYAPPSRRRPKFGSRAAATRGQTYSSEAPSSSSIVIRGDSRRGGSLRRTRRAPSGGSPPRPRAATGSSREPVIASARSAAPTRLPRRPEEKCATAIPSNTTADAVVAAAPNANRLDAASSSTAGKPRRLSHISVAATAAAAADNHASRRTLIHPGENTLRLMNSRTSIVT